MAQKCNFRLNKLGKSMVDDADVRPTYGHQDSGGLNVGPKQYLVTRHCLENFLFGRVHIELKYILNEIGKVHIKIHVSYPGLNILVN